MCFFDNDATVVVPFKETIFLKSHPPQIQHQFEGRDTDGSKIRISFNESRLTGYVTFKAGTSKSKTLEAQDGCRADNSVDL